MSLPRTVAHFVTHRRRLVGLVAVLIAVASVLVIVFGVHFASDILDLLPKHFDSVRSFKTFDREFTQAREVTFALVDETGECDLDGFTEHFASALRSEPWVVRVMDRSPIETPAAVHEVRSIAAPLLLNLEPSAFDDAIAALAPAAIDARLTKLHAELEAGSPKAEFQLDFDPLGLVAPALKPLSRAFTGEETRPLSSPDGTLRLILAITNQPDLGAHTCQAVMRSIADFKTRVLATWSGPRPQILVTGRTAYVGELSLTMRRDVISTLASSAALVAIVFWLGFRRLRPLVSIMHVLLLCCLVSVAFGALVFHELNMITIGLCAILIGLGVDFGMMLYGIYQAEREEGHDHETAIASALRHHGSGVIFGALTTAAAFLCLLLSDTAGFAQLGVLIACGILVAALFMMTVFFVFIGKKHRPRPGCTLRAGSECFIRIATAHPLRMLVPAAALLLGLTTYTLAPMGRVQFEADPKSLEPKDSLAGTALRTIMAKMPSVGEPVIAIVEATDREEFHRRWNVLNTAWSKLVAEGRLKSVNSPAAFALSPERTRANAARLASIDFPAARTALTTAIQREGFSEDSFQTAFAFLDTLAAVAKGDLTALDWQKNLPAQSAWWFVIDRFLAHTPNLGVAYVAPLKKIASVEEKEQLRELLTVPGIDMHLSGWTYALQDLVPWAKSKLVVLTVTMLGLNVVLLLFLYRSFFPLFILMLSLVLSVGALVASLALLGIPLNLFNILAFPLVLGVGVDYGIYVVIAMRAPDPLRELTTILKPVLLSGLTTVAGFGSLITANNPSLRGLGAVCAFGVGWCLFSTFLLIIPAYLWRDAR